MYTPIYRLLIIWILAIPTFANGQKTEFTQVSGVVLSRDSLQALAYTSIIIKHTQFGTISDNSGYFSLFVHPGDTLQFSNVGYKTAQFVLPKLLGTAHYSLLQLMQKDTILLAEVSIRPWPDLEDFMQAFLDPEMADPQKVRTAQTRKELQVLLKHQMELEKVYYDQLRYSKLYQTSGIVPPNNFLNPFTWAKFVKDWKRGAFKNREGYLPRPIDPERAVDNEKR